MIESKWKRLQTIYADNKKGADKQLRTNVLDYESKDKKTVQVCGNTYNVRMVQSRRKIKDPLGRKANTVMIQMRKKE